MMKIIALTREHIGDLVGTTPALHSLRHLYPGAHITVEVGERAACVLENNPYVDEILLRPQHQGIMGKLRFILLLLQRRFDLGVVFDTSPDMFLYLWLGRVPRRVGLVRKRRFAQLLTDPIPFDPSMHETVDNFRNVVAHLGGDISNVRTELFPSPQDRMDAGALLAEEGINPNKTLIGLNLGASLPSNRWLLEHFAALGDLLAQRPNTQILLLGGPQDTSLADAVAASMRACPISLAGRLTVLQLAEVLRRCAVVVSGDTGPMHLAVAVQTPVVALFGPAEPRESGPGYAEGHQVIRKVTGCPGCTKSVCGKNHACMRAITPEEVANAVSHALDRQSARMAHFV